VYAWHPTISCNPEQFTREWLEPARLYKCGPSAMYMMSMV